MDFPVERLTQVLIVIPDVVRGIGAGLGLGLAQRAATARKVNKKRKKKQSKNPKRGTPNAFGCLDVGIACTAGSKCCSGLCDGTKGKRTCRAHNTGSCAAEDDACREGPAIACGRDAFCFRTTGKASFCGGEGVCEVCARDAECEAAFGPGAACVVCDNCDSKFVFDTACLPAAV